MRIGFGYDVHAFGDGDHVMLGGVRIPHARGIVAHSDGDVAIQALCDAILGALAEGDIGRHFPPSDPRWRGADSRLFLRMAGLAARGMMARDAALRAVTSAGAEILDLGDRIGTLTAGKDADFIILSGDPLSAYTVVEKTYVEGRLAFDRSDEEDLLYALGGYGANHDVTPYFCCYDEILKEGN